MVHHWFEDALGRQQIRRACAACGAKAGFAPQVEPFVTEANTAANPLAPVDLLLLAAESGVALKSDGRVATFASREDYLRADLALRKWLEECRARLGRLMGRRPS
jgi:hypothetical protein